MLVQRNPLRSAEQIRLANLRIHQDQLFDWSLTDTNEFCGLQLIAGMDLSRFPDADYAVATIVVLSFPELAVFYERSVIVQSSVPYIPGFLAFREVPPLAALLEELPTKMTPQVVFVDGNGAFHPRQCGAATHLGVATGFPTIGVAKKVLAVGEVNTTVAREVSRELQSGGTWAPLIDPNAELDEEPLAALLRPTDGRAPPLVVSPGHRISLQTAATLTAAVCRHSVAEPIRQADLRSRHAVRSWLSGAELPTLRLGEPGMKRKSGQASLLPVVNRMLKQEKKLRNTAGTSVEKGGEMQQNAEGVWGSWDYGRAFFSWLLDQSVKAIFVCTGRERHDAEEQEVIFVCKGREQHDSSEKGNVPNKSNKSLTNSTRNYCAKHRKQLTWHPKV
jgi:deoxyinosine 3'endonuclease (endonuclease V)